MNYSVVIADDEEVVRQGMAELVAAGDLGFRVAGVARDGAQALELVRQCRPDVLITDICMPRLDGIGLVDQLRQLDLSTRVIIVSGFDDFAYAQSAIRLGVSDYLLKPVLPDKLSGILAGIRRTLEEEQLNSSSLEELRQRAEASRPLFRDRYLVSLLEGRLQSPTADGRAASLGLRLEAQAWAVGVLQFDLAAACRLGDDGVELVRQFLASSLESQFAEPVLVESCFLAENQIGVLFLCHDGERTKLTLRINQNGQKVLTGLERRFGVRASLGIGCIKDSLDDVPASLRSARDALALGFNQPDAPGLRFAEPGLRRVQCGKPTGADATLVSLVKMADREGARAQLAAMFAEWTACSPMPAGLVLAEGLETMMALRRAVEDYEDIADANAGLLPPCADLIAAAAFDRFRAILSAYTERVLEAFSVLRAGRGADLVERARNLILTRYHEEHLSIETMAACLFVSPNYLRQLFRAKAGITLIDFLNKVRMEKAVELLADPSLLIQAVAERTGFGNQRYFSMCFKKYHGKTPSEFRERA